MKFSVILAGASVRSLAEVALRDGHRPLCIDMFGDADLRRRLATAGLDCTFRRIGSFSDLPDALTDVDASIPLVWTGGLENHLGVLRTLRQQRPVRGATIEAIQRSRDVSELQRVLDGSGCRVPETHPVSEMGVLDVPHDGTWLFKPQGTSGGLGILAIDGVTAADRTSSSGVLQRCVAGSPFSATFVANDESCRFVGAACQIVGERRLGARDFWFCGNSGPVKLPESVKRIVQEAGRRIAHLGLRGVFGIDFIAEENGATVWFLEVNPRLTASHEIYDFNRLTGSLLSHQVEAGRIDSAEPVSTASPIVRSVVYSLRNGSLSGRDVEILLKETGDLEGRADFSAVWLADIPNPGPFFRGQPFCSIYRQIRADNIASGGAAGLGDELRSLLAHHTGILDPNVEHSKAGASRLFEFV